MELIFFRKFIQNGLRARTFQFWHAWRNFRPKKEIFHPMSENGFKVIFFSRKTSFFSKCSLDTRKAVLTTLLKLFRQKTEIFCSFHKTQEFLVSPKHSSSKHSTGHVKCLLDDHGVFRPVKMFSAKPWKDIKI